MNKILEHAKNIGAIDDEHLAYFPQDHPFTLKEFREFTDEFMHPHEKMTKYFVQDIFETYLIPIEEEGQKFILRVMYGQGMAVTLFTEEEWFETKKEIDKLTEEFDAKYAGMTDSEIDEAMEKEWRLQNGVATQA